MEAHTIIFKRKLYNTLLEWKATSQGATAVLIEGARRVGKSTLAEEFAKNEYDSYILIDFSKASRQVKDLFEDLSDLNYLFMQLQLIFQVQLYERKSLIIFDEVQKAPPARQAIKHLVADHRYDYIETGSLISIRKNVKDILIPSEEEKMYLHPMDYEEFKWAIGDTATVPLLRQLFASRKSIGDAVNRKLMRDFRLYMLVGGMPQAVDTYIKTNNLSAVDKTKRGIIDIYESDFEKIDTTGKAKMLYDAIPGELNKNSSRYQITTVIGNNVEDGLKNVLLQTLKESMTVNFAYHSNNPSVGFSLSTNQSKYKLYTSDTGLFITLACKDKDFTENDLYQRILNDKISADLGYVYENMVAQMLRAAGHNLFYYTWPTPSEKHYFEIDFLISENNKIIPIEVKSSGYKKHVSMDEFCKKFSDKVLKRYLIYTKDMRKEEQLVYLPIYLTMFL